MRLRSKQDKTRRQNRQKHSIRILRDFIFILIYLIYVIYVFVLQPITRVEIRRSLFVSIATLTRNKTIQTIYLELQIKP